MKALIPLLFAPVLAFSQTFEMVADINPTGSSGPVLGREFQGKLFFSANDGLTGQEIWMTSGTPESTTLLKDVNELGSAAAFPLTVFNNKLFLSANDGINGKKFWTTDGTEAGTQMYYNFNMAGDDLPPFLITPVAYNDALFFIVISDAFFQEVLWKGDETGPIFPVYFSQPVGQLFRPTIFQDKLYFVAYDLADAATQLWVTDGQDGGQTELVVELGSNLTDLSVRSLGVHYDKLYFTASNGPQGYELWVSDGTPGGTAMVLDINPSGDSNPGFLGEINGTVFFRASDGQNGSEIWTSTGTPSNTQLFMDINPGSGSSLPEAMLPIGGLWFFAADDGVHGRELWVTDGTIAGTSLFMDINPYGDANPGPLYEYGDKFLFEANDSIHGRELWITDGTQAGTNLFADMNPNGHSAPQFVGRLDGYIYWALDDGVHGRELWRLAPPPSSSPERTVPKLLEVFPNPASEYIWVDIAVGEPAQIVDAEGTLIRSFFIQPGKPVDVSDLAPGIYILSLATSHRTGKFAINK